MQRHGATRISPRSLVIGVALVLAIVLVIALVTLLVANSVGAIGS